MKSESRRNLSLFILAISFVALIYGTIKALEIAGRTQVGTKNGIYTSYVTTSQEIDDKAKELTKDCETKLCKVQRLLDFANRIPYYTKTFQRYSPQQTIKQNFGDCDDKSNLLISMLKALHIKAYFVLVPQHIFVIVPLKDKRLDHIRGLWVNDRKFYILESTAKDSKVGYPLKYALDEIDVIIEPFSNVKIPIKRLEYKL
jgi:uncharacterized protein YoxC